MMSSALKLQPMDFAAEVVGGEVTVDGGHFEGAVAEHRLEGDEAAAAHQVVAGEGVAQDVPGRLGDG